MHLVITWTPYRDVMGINFLTASDDDGVTIANCRLKKCPDSSVLRCSLKRKKQRDIRRPCNIKKSCWCAMVLHKGQPLIRVVVWRDMFQVEVSLCLEET